MGVEDLNLDLRELADNILIICNDPDAAQTIGQTLEARSYNWVHAQNLESASEHATAKHFDLVVLCFSDQATEPFDTVKSVRSDRILSKYPLILLHPNLEDFEKLGWTRDDKVVMLKYPVDPAHFLVKVTTLLRLRKFRSEQVRADAKLAEQNAQLRDLTNRFKAEMREAQSIQKSLLPTSLPEDSSCIVAARYIPVEAVGGDLYDIWRIDEEHIGLFIGDVTGHGLSAAFVGAMTKMALHYASKSQPDTMLSDMNEGMADLMPEGRFVAVAAAVYNTKSGVLRVTRGGQPNPYIWRAAANTVEMVTPRGMALGMVSGIRYQMHETVLEPGDKFMMLTDGLTETTDMDGVMLGPQGVSDYFGRSAPELRIDRCLNYILFLQEQFSGGRILKDDVTLVGLERFKK